MSGYLNTEFPSCGPYIAFKHIIKNFEIIIQIWTIFFQHSSFVPEKLRIKQTSICKTTCQITNKQTNNLPTYLLVLFVPTGT
jgi:ATP sulfurylase